MMMMMMSLSACIQNMDLIKYESVALTDILFLSSVIPWGMHNVLNCSELIMP